MILFRATWALFYREIIRFVRQRSRLIGALLTPLLFWFLVGSGVGKSFQYESSGSAGYFEFFFPGTLALSVLFTAIFSTMSVIEDRHQGFLQGVLVSPVPRGAFVLAKILSGATLGILQGLFLILVALLSGALSINFSELIWILLILFVTGAALTAMGFAFAWKLDSVQGYHGIMNVVMMPMWILSGAVFPMDGANQIFFWLGKINPLSYPIKSLQEIMLQHSSQGIVLALVVSLIFLIALYSLSLNLVTKNSRS